MTKRVPSLGTIGKSDFCQGLANGCRAGNNPPVIAAKQGNSNMQDILEAGNVVEFWYPRHNFEGTNRSCKERRIIVVERVRDLREEPLCELTLQQHASLRRGSLLVIGLDLQKNETRSFYVESMTRLRLAEQPTIPLPPLRIAVIRDGKVARYCDMSDPRQRVCNGFLETPTGSIAIPV